MKSVILLAALGIALVCIYRHDIGAPLGATQEGRNAAEWALASDGIEAHGLIGSRLGAIHADGTVYADHPPLTGFVTATSMALLGRNETAVRLPALLTALATIPLLWLVLRRMGLTHEVAAVGCVIALATPMFVGFGPMVDTPTMSFPFGLALLAAWLAPTRREWLLALLATAAVLFGWQAALLVTLVAGIDVVRGLRDRRRDEWGVACGLVVGLVLLGSWLTWVHGSVGPVLDQLRYRSGNGDLSIGLVRSVRVQALWLRSQLGLIAFMVGIAGCVLAVRRRELRVTTAVAVVVVVAYGLLLRQAAFIHSYWNYWSLLPIAIGLATVASLVQELPTESDLVRTATTGGLSAIAIVAIATVAVLPSREPPEVYAAVAPLRHAAVPASQERLWVVGHVESPTSWVEFYARRPLTEIRTVASLERVQRQHPDDLVYIVPGCVDEPVCRAIDGGSGSRYRLVPARRIGLDNAGR